MGRTALNLPTKRGRPNSSRASESLSDVDHQVYNLIKSKEGTGILVGDLRRELKLQDAAVKKSLKALESQKLIKGIVDVHHKLNKYYMAVEFEPSKDITGGSWYSEGKLDLELIRVLKDLCLKHIDKLKVVTIEGVSDFVRRSGIAKTEIPIAQVTEVIAALILDNEIEELKSDGKGDFSNVPLGKTCYRRLSRGLSVTGAMSSLPCGVCPRISECTPDGIISPMNCVYFKKWLDF